MSPSAPRSPARRWSRVLGFLPLVPFLMADQSQCASANPTVSECPKEVEVEVRVGGEYGGQLYLLVSLAPSEGSTGELALQVNPVVGLPLPGYKPNGVPSDGKMQYVVWQPGAEAIAPKDDVYGALDGYRKNESGQPVAALRDLAPVCRVPATISRDPGPWRSYPSRKVYFIVDASNKATVVSLRDYLDVYNGDGDKKEAASIFSSRAEVVEVKNNLRINAVWVRTVLGEAGTEVRAWVQNVRGKPVYISKQLLAEHQTTYKTSITVGGTSGSFSGEGDQWRKDESLRYGSLTTDRNASTLFGSGTDLAFTFTTQDGASAEVSASLRPVPASVLSVLKDAASYATADKAGELSIVLNPDHTADPALPQNWCFNEGSPGPWSRPAGSDASKVVLCSQ